MKDAYHKFLKRIAHFQVEHPGFVIIIIAVMTIAMVGGAAQVRTVASLEQMMPQDVQEIKAFNTLRDNGLGQDIIAIIVELDRESTNPLAIQDIRDYRVYEYVNDLQAVIALQPDILEVHTLTDILGNDLDEEVYTQVKNNPLIFQYVNEDYTTTLLLATTDVGANDDRMNLLATRIKKDVQGAGLPPGITVRYTGTPIIQQRLGELIAKDRNNTQWISTLLVFIIVMITFGTFTSAIVPILVVTASVNWLYGTMGYTNLPISTLAGGVAAMVIGIGIDFAIHIMSKFKYERKKGYAIKESIELAVMETGTALTATSITTIAAFLAFLVGVMPEMGRFGLLMAIGITYSLVFSLFGLPALLVLEEKIIYRYGKKMKFGVEGEFHLESDNKGVNND